LNSYAQQKVPSERLKQKTSSQGENYQLIAPRKKNNLAKNFRNNKPMMDFPWRLVSIEEQ